MRLRVIWILGLGVFASGCASSFVESDLSRAMMDHAGESKNDLYYQGSDDESDYFVADRHMSDQRMRVRRGQVTIERRFPKTSDSSYWTRLNPYYPHGVMTMRKNPNVVDPLEPQDDFGL